MAFTDNYAFSKQIHYQYLLLKAHLQITQEIQDLERESLTVRNIMVLDHQIFVIV